jgi:hypothetical protein
MVQNLVLEFKKGIKLDPASFAALKDNMQWDSVHQTLKGQICYQDVDDVLDLSCVPSKQKYMYSVQASRSRKKSALID